MLHAAANACSKRHVKYPDSIIKYWDYDSTSLHLLSIKALMIELRKNQRPFSLKSFLMTLERCFCYDLFIGPKCDLNRKVSIHNNAHISSTTI